MAPLLADVTKLDSNNAMIYIGLGIAAFIYIAVVRPMMRRKSDPLDRAPAYASLAQQRATERQMQGLLVDLSEMARQISGQLDSRAAKLELLIQQADQRLAELRQAQQGELSASPVTNHYDVPPPMIDALPVSASPPSAPPLPPEPIDPVHQQIYHLADEGRESNAIAIELARPKGEIELILALRGK